MSRGDVKPVAKDLGETSGARLGEATSADSHGGANARAHVQKKRLRKAALLVFVVLLTVPFTQLIANKAILKSQSEELVYTGDALDSSSLSLWADPFDALEHIEQLSSAGTAADGSTPCSLASDSDFMREVGLLAGACELRASSDASVVSYALNAQTQELTPLVEQHMGSQGWTGVSLGSLSGETFVKSTGALRWVFVSYTQISDETILVFRCVMQ